MSYVPRLFVDIGRTNAFFTLRQTELHHIPGPGDMGNAVVNGVYQGTVVESSFHIVNLSQDPAEAWAKAQEHAQRLGLRLSGDPAKLDDERREIIRATAEQVERRRAEEAAAIAERQRLQAEWAAKYEADVRAAIDEGRITFGNYNGHSIEFLPRGYLNWVANTSFEEGSRMAYLSAVIRSKYAHLLLPAADASLHVGEVGKRRDWSGTVVRYARFETDFGPLCITTIVEDGTSACLVVKSGSWACSEIGKHLSFKATVKEHNEYKGQAQTVLQRVKEI